MQILYGLVVVPVYVVKGLGPFYGFVWSFFTALILVTVLNIAMQALKTRARPFLVASTAALLTESVAGRAFVAIDYMTWYFWVIGIQSCILLWAGIVTMGLARFEQFRRTLFILGLYWIVEAGFDFAFCVKWPEWLAYNTWAPPIIGVVAFTAILIGWRRDSEIVRLHNIRLARAWVASK